MKEMLSAIDDHLFAFILIIGFIYGIIELFVRRNKKEEEQP